MDERSRGGRASELIVAGELLRHGLDPYLTWADDKAIDLLLRHERSGSVEYYNVQVKSVKGYNRILGVKNPRDQSGRYILIIHYRHPDRDDEFFYLTADQIIEHWKEESGWGDLVFNKPERERYVDQDLQGLAVALDRGALV